MGRGVRIVSMLAMAASVAVIAPASATERGGPYCRGVAATMVGTPGDDVMIGTEGDDVVFAGPGDDVVRGGGGNDIVCGGAGDDILDGGAGHDILAGDRGADVLTGDEGADILFGGPGDDRLEGGWGNDVLLGLAGNDLLVGGNGDDRLGGQKGDDTLAGNAGEDRLGGGGGRDTADGGVGLDDCVAESMKNCDFASLEPGDGGALVRHLQRRLAAKGLYRGPTDGDYGPQTEASVIAFHKVLGLSRTNRWSEGDWGRLEAFRPVPPTSRPGQPDRIEVDLTRQVLYLIFDGDVAGIFPVSTSGDYLYERYDGQIVGAHTPRGSFTLWRYQAGWTETYLGGIYNAWSFTSAYALHGSRSVPPWPVSHGCVRVNTWEADWLASRLWIGLPIHIWD